MLSRYTAVGQAQQTLEEMAASCRVPVDTLVSAVTVVNPPDTANVRVTVSLANPRQAADVANGIAGRIIEAVTQDALLKAGQVQRAVPPTHAAGLGHALEIILAVSVGLIAAGGAPLLAESLVACRSVELGP